MSSMDRQNSLLAAEDWKRVYQTFREADFQSYDFETLRKTMIDYIRLYYPEDYNDFIESSEYIALIDLIAFLGQSLAFRTDLNSRENFLDTAERRDSILKLARLVGYSPKRSIPAAGLLKIASVTTTESVVDSNGFDLSNLPITWNDVTNSNWLEQFTLIVNATLLNSQVVGKSGNSQTINSVKTDEYTINIASNTLPAFTFNATVGGASMSFEAVSATSAGQPYIYEVPPKPASKFNILYRNDNQGNSSVNTGFFVYFKQGKLQSADFSIAEALPNRVLSIGYSNINNTDVWLYDVNSSGTENNQWTSVPAVAGVNVIYNKSTERNLYQINTTAGDQIDLVFGDGSFANVPQGAYRLYFRTSNSQSYKITPDEIQNASISIPYISRAGHQETLTIRASLSYTVANATSNESIDEIRSKAPQQYYSQGRMITGEDYNIIPYTTFSNILKVKAVNRTSSGVSRFLDVNDSSGKYSSTNIFAQDGFLYKESTLDSTNFTFLTSSGVQQLIQDELTTILGSKEIQHFYYENVIRTEPYVSELVNGTTEYRPVLWNVNSINSDGCTGYMYYDTTLTNPETGNPTSIVVQIGDSTSATTKDVKVGAILKFAAPEGYYFNSQNHISPGTPRFNGDKLFIYTSVTNIVGDGTYGGAISPTSKQGPVTLSVKVPSTAILSEIIPVFKTRVPTTMVTTIVNKILAFNNFALRYDLKTTEWTIVEEYNLTNPIGSDPFSWDNAGKEGDNSWFIRFEYSSNVGYNIYWRSTNYYFESQLETKFYFDEKVKIYDSKTGTTIKDTIKILKVNPAPTTAESAYNDATTAVKEINSAIAKLTESATAALTMSGNSTVLASAQSFVSSAEAAASAASVAATLALEAEQLAADAATNSPSELTELASLSAASNATLAAKTVVAAEKAALAANNVISVVAATGTSVPTFILTAAQAAKSAAQIAALLASTASVNAASIAATAASAYSATAGTLSTQKINAAVAAANTAAIAAESATLAANNAKIAADNAIAAMTSSLSEMSSVVKATAIAAQTMAKAAKESQTATPQLGIDYTWNVHKNVVDLDGYENQSKVLLTFTDNNADGIPDNPDIFDMVVAPEYETKYKLVFFEREVKYTGFVSYAPTTSFIDVEYAYKSDIDLSSVEVLEGYLYYTTAENKFYKVEIIDNVKTLVEQVDIYLAYVGRGGASPDQGGLYFQYRHNSPSYRRIDPSPSNIIDLYLLTKVFATDYQAWIRDTTNSLEEPQPPTTDQLTMEYGKLENYKAISDTIIFNSARFKSLFGAKADPLLQATFKVVKNASLNLSDNDIKSNVVSAINTFFSIENWDFGETFYFSELSAYLHTVLSPNVSSIIIVPLNPTSMFGSLYQINAEANEILSSSATVDNIEIISAITAAAINANFSSVNNNITLGNI